MIRPVKKRSSPDIEVGTISPFLWPELLNNLHSEDFNQERYLVPLIDINSREPYETLSKLNIDTFYLRDMYECPYTGMEFYSFVPMFLLTDDLSKFLRPTPDNEKLFDKEYQWQQNFKASTDQFIKCDIYSYLAGPGYTYENKRSDGRNMQRLFAIDLSDGSTIIGLTHIWVKSSDT